MRFKRICYISLLLIMVAGCVRKSPIDKVKVQDFSIVYGNSRRGEVEPCGCVVLQLGGLPKKVSVVQKLLSQNKLLLNLDGGDLFLSSLTVPDELSAQWDLRGKVVRRGYDRMHLDVTTVGELDLALGRTWYEEQVRDGKFQVVTSNIFDTSTNDPWFSPYVVKSVGTLKIGVFGVLEPSLVPSGDPRFSSLKVMPYLPIAKAIVEELRDKESVDLVIALAHLGIDRELQLASDVKGIDVVIGGHGVDEPKRIFSVGETMFLRSSFEGRKVGVAHLKFDSSRRGWFNVDRIKQLQEQRESIDKTLVALRSVKKNKTIREQIKETETELAKIEKQIPSDTSELNEYKGGLIPLVTEMRDDPETAQWLEKYQQQLASINKGKSTDLSSVKGPIFATHLRCAKCHQKQYNVWLKSSHAKAWKTLVSKKQQFNLECMKCHTVGFKDNRGYGTALKDLQRTVSVRGVSKNFDYRTVQCEHCHGARSTHPGEKVGVKKVTPSRCMNCHDPKNSPNFNVTTYWVVGTEAQHGHEPICVRGLPGS